MYAVLFQVDFKPDWPGDLEAEIAELVEGTKQSPGFVRGTWARQEAQGVSFIVMADEASARAMADNAEAPPEASVTIRSVDVFEIWRDV